VRTAAAAIGAVRKLSQWWFLCAYSLLPGFAHAESGSVAQVALQRAEDAAGNWLVLRSWKTHSTASPQWKASVSTVDAYGPGEGLVAQCGSSSRIAYVVRTATRPQSRNESEVDVVILDMRSGEARRHSIAVPNVETATAAKPDGRPEARVRFDAEEKDALWIACSPDAKRLLLEMRAIVDKQHRARKLVLADLDANRLVDLGEAVFDRLADVEGRMIDQAFMTLLAPQALAPKARQQGFHVLALERIAEIARQGDPQASQLKAFPGRAAVWVLAEARIRQSAQARAAVIRIGRDGAPSGTCALDRSPLHSQSGGDDGLLITARAPGSANSAGLYLARMPRQGASCATPSVAAAFDVREGIPAFGSSPAALLRTQTALPGRTDVPFVTRFLSVTSSASHEVLSATLNFRGKNEEQPLVWWSTDVVDAEQATFVYGPVGRETAFVHFWRPR
jgi:hypothetical protein